MIQKEQTKSAVILPHLEAFCNMLNVENGSGNEERNKNLQKVDVEQNCVFPMQRSWSHWGRMTRFDL